MVTRGMKPFASRSNSETDRVGREGCRERNRIEGLLVQLEAARVLNPYHWLQGVSLESFPSM